MEDSKEKIIKRTLDKLVELRGPRDAVWEDIIRFILPGLEKLDLFKQTLKGTRIDADRYDGTGISALQLFADGLFGYLISPNIAWLKLTMKEELMQYPEIRRWLQEVEEHFYGVFNQTNFYDAMSTYFEYAPAFGFSTMYSEEDVNTGKIVFETCHPGPIYLIENKFGYVDTVYRKWKFYASQAIERFGNSVSDKIKKANKKHPFEEYDFIQVVMPREKRDIFKIDSVNKPFASIWMEVLGDRENVDGKIVRESGFDMNPFHVWRFKKGTTPYGFGPGEEALVEIMGANEIQKSMLKAAQKSVEPPLNVPGYMEGEVDVGPNGMNYYKNPDERIFPVDRGVDFPIGIDREERIQKAIEKHFKVEFFTLLSTLNMQQGNAKTATEVIELQGEKAAVLGRPINRLNNECLNPIIDRVFDIEAKAGRLPPMPPILQDMQGEKIDVDYTGPLAQAQKKLWQVQGTQQGLEQIAPLAELKPEILDIIDGDETARHILRINGFPQKAINDRNKVMQIRQARQQMMEQENAKEDMGMMADVVEKVAKADNASGGRMMEAMNANQAA